MNRSRPLPIRTAACLLLLGLAAPAEARFGFDADDPIRTETVPGEYRYLARLRGADGTTEVKARRQGSTFIAGFDFPMDVWNLSCGTNAATVYVYGYGPTNSLVAPEGFSLRPEDAPGLVEPEHSTSFSVNPDGSNVALYGDDRPPADPEVRAVVEELLRIARKTKETLESDFDGSTEDQKSVVQSAFSESLRSLRAVDASKTPEDFRKAFDAYRDAFAAMVDLLQEDLAVLINPPEEKREKIENTVLSFETAATTLIGAAVAHGVPSSLRTDVL